MRYVIVGNGIAGVSAAQVLRQRDDRAEIVLIGDETDVLFARTALMWVYMKQMTREDLRPYEGWYWRENDLRRVRDRVTGIDTSARRLELAAGRPMTYDRLLMAVGAEANRFGWPGQDLDGVCTMCTMGDLDRLEALRPRLRSAVVVGGGLIGIELVEMMVHDRVPVVYLIREPWYWNLVLSRQEAEIVHQRLRDHGVDLVLEDEIAEIVGNEAGQVDRVLTREGLELPGQLLGIAVGVHPRTALAEAAGIACGKGIQVDASMRTSAEHVFAAGDCAEIDQGPGRPPRIEQLWYTGIKQGRAAARAMLGDVHRYDPGVPYNSAQFLFLDYCNVGWMNGARHAPPEALYVPPAGADGLGLEELFHRSPKRPDTVRIAHAPGSGQVLGFSMLGSRWDCRVLMRWIEERRGLPWVLEHLREASFNEEFRRYSFEEVRDHA